MAVRDIRSQLQPTVVHSAAITSATTTNGSIIDNANFELGLMFVVQCSAYTNGTYNFTIEHGDDSGLSDATAVTSDMLIGTLDNLKTTALSGAGSVLKTIGLFSNKRYVRINVVSTASSGSGAWAFINITAVQSAELVKVV